MPNFAIGNGVSRLDLPTAGLKERGTVWASNWAGVDIPSHNLIAVDRDTLFNILSTKQTGDTLVWSRAKWARRFQHESPIYSLPESLYEESSRWDNTRHWGSGTYAVWQAAQNTDAVIMLGYDLWGGNVYAARPDYSGEDVKPASWIHQLKVTFQRHPGVEFVSIQPDGWQAPLEWASIENFSTDTPDGWRDFLG